MARNQHQVTSKMWFQWICHSKDAREERRRGAGNSLTHPHVGISVFGLA